jgi:hypothetical protein
MISSQFEPNEKESAMLRSPSATPFHERMIKTILMCLGVACIAVAAPQADAQKATGGTCAVSNPGNKKLLETGWDTPSPSFLKANIGAMQTRPFDGLIIRGSGPQEVFTRVTTPANDFAQDRADLSSIDWGRFTDNFIILQSGTPDGWDWFNDADWAASEANAREFAKLAKVANLKGVLFDAEPYLNNPWNYSQRPDAANRTFAQYQSRCAHAASALCG